MPVIGTRVPATVPLARLLLTAALLGLVGLVNQVSSMEGDASDDTVRCALEPPRDAAGLEACVSRSPRDVELLLDLGTVYEASGRLDDALASYRRAVEVDPRDADARVRLGMALRQSGDLDGARREGAAAARFRPHDQVARGLVSSEGAPAATR